jgi:hypothetical protein
MDAKPVGPTPHEAKKAEMEGDTNPYTQLAWLVYTRVTSTSWFEAFIMCNIVLIGVSTGLELQFGDEMAVFAEVWGQH